VITFVALPDQVRNRVCRCCRQREGAEWLEIRTPDGGLRRRWIICAICKAELKERVSAA
jgi:hypothetical protein